MLRLLKKSWQENRRSRSTVGCYTIIVMTTQLAVSISTPEVWKTFWQEFWSLKTGYFSKTFSKVFDMNSCACHMTSILARLLILSRMFTISITMPHTTVVDLICLVSLSRFRYKWAWGLRSDGCSTDSVDANANAVSRQDAHASAGCTDVNIKQEPNLSANIIASGNDATCLIGRQQPHGG